MRQEPLSNTSISLLGSRKLSYTESPIIPQIILKEEEEEKDVKKLASTWLQQGVTYSRQSRHKEESTFRCWKATLWAKHMQNMLLRPMAPSKATSKDSWRSSRSIGGTLTIPTQQALPRVPLCLPLQLWTHGIFSSLIKYFVS